MKLEKAMQIAEIVQQALKDRKDVYVSIISKSRGGERHVVIRDVAELNEVVLDSEETKIK
jgi:uncharacterized protein (UPF0248 family)